MGARRAGKRACGRAPVSCRRLAVERRLCAALEQHASPQRELDVHPHHALGRGRDPGDEEGYLTSMRPCTWGPDTAPRLARLHPLRLVAVYEARRTHYGVMSGISARAHTPT